ncbi:MAG: hypothetical protein Fur0037_23450 [Planctomycetota bacterium]
MGFANSGGPPLANVPVARAKDIDGDGTILVPDELFAFVTDGTTQAPSGTNFMTDGRYAIEDGEFAFYFTDSEFGRVRRGVDANHDGFLDATELNDYFLFGLSSANAGLFAPDSIAVYRDAAAGQTRVYVALDNSLPSSLGYTRGIWRLLDLNGDGDALDAGESSLFVSASMGLQVPGNTGPVTITRDYWRTLRMLPGGKLLAYAQGASLMPTGTPPTYTIQPEMNAWYGFTDNNGTAVPEVWFNASALNDLPMHPDFANGTFPNWDVQDQVTLRRMHYVRFVGVSPGAGPAGEDVYFIGSSYRTINEGDVNLNGQHIGGLIYRVLDANHNQVIDAGELALFCNISGNTYAGVAPVTFTNIVNNQPILTMDNSTWGFDAGADGSVQLLYDNASTNDAIVNVADANGNGVIDQGEVVMTYATVQGPSGYPYPFNSSLGPYFSSLMTLPAARLPGPFPTGITPIGDGCISQTTGWKVVMDAIGAPQVGNANFQVATIRSDYMLPSWFLMDVRQSPAPVPLAPIGLPGCFSYLLNPVYFSAFIADPLGRTAVTVGIPNNPSLIGVNVLFQGVVMDPASAAMPFAVTNALHINIQP